MILPSACRPRRSGATRLAAAALGTLLLVACASPGGPTAVATPAATAASATAYLERARAQVSTRDQVSVRATALRAAESQAHFGLPLADRGVQPVWLEIENHSPQPYWLMRSFMDASYYAPREVARLFKSQVPADALRAAQTRLIDDAIKLHVAPGHTVSGFVYTTKDRGLKLMNVELLGVGRVLRFDLAEDQPDGNFDYEASRIRRATEHQSARTVTVRELGAEIERMPCCTTDADGKGLGDPLNIVFVGAERDVLVALVRAGWDFTETINAASVGRMVSAFAFGGGDRTSPVSPLYVGGRPQELAMQHARTDIAQRSHLRLWLSPLQVEGQPVWIGQISRDIGVKVTNMSKTLTPHVIDPQVDHARFRLLETLLHSGNVERWGYVDGVEAASREHPRTNLTEDPYFTDGKRLVVFISKTPRAMDKAGFISWTRSEP